MVVGGAVAVADGCVLSFSAWLVIVVFLERQKFLDLLVVAVVHSSRDVKFPVDARRTKRERSFQS